MLLRKLPIKGAEAGKYTHGGLSMRRFLTLAPIFLCCACMLLAEGKEKEKGDSAVQRKVAGLRAGTTKASDTVRVIVQTNGDPDAQGVSSHIGTIGGKVLHKFNAVSGTVAEVPAQSLQALASHRGVSRVSLDEKVVSHDTSDTSTSTLTAAQIQSYLALFDNNRDTTGAPEVWFKYGVAGQDIGVAVIDSGIADVTDLPNVVKTVDFTVSPIPGRADPYGHGTHVAGILAGSGLSSSYRYLGIAPMAHLINHRVLDQKGAGYTS